ncbi:MAG: hypothetical protein V1808_03850 [Candidatus Daviesbacteria bacterium]
MIILTNIYLFILASILAIMEIQIEGQNGWAKNLPTWRAAPHKWYAKLYKKIMSGKEITGYHLSIFTLVFLILNLPYFFGLPFNLENFSKTISLYFIFVVLWDFLWFVLNPYYPIKKFKKEHLAFQHPKWFLGLPQDYYLASLTSFLVLLPAIILNPSNLSWWLINVFLFIFQIILVILFTLYVLKIDNWNNLK